MKFKKVIILTATFGMGHKAVSKAIKDELEDAYDQYQIDIVDLFEILSPSLKDAFQKGYNVLTRDFEELYNFFYQYKKNQKHNLLDGILYLSYQKKFNHYMALEKPDVVISTFPLTSGFMSRYKTQMDVETPLITVITDVVDSWEWLHQGTDQYFVPSVEVKDRLRLKGIEGFRITVTGIPVRRDFKADHKGDHKGSHKVAPNREVATGKVARRSHVLLMSSAMGKIKFDQSFLKDLNQMRDVDFTIVTGTDETLYKQLKDYKYDNITILGFVDDIAALMDSADLIYTKPGGVTLFEAINSALPLLVQDTSVGQETDNIDFIKSRGIGMIVEDPETFCLMIKEVLNDNGKLKWLRQNMIRLKREFDENALLRALEA